MLKIFYWIFGILLKNKYKLSKEIIIKRLQKKNIQTRNFFYPMHKQKVFQKMKIFPKKMKLPNSEFLAKNGFYIPSGLGITNKEIDIVSKNINEIIV